MIERNQIITSLISEKFKGVETRMKLVVIPLISFYSFNRVCKFASLAITYLVLNPPISC